METPCSGAAYLYISAAGEQHQERIVTFMPCLWASHGIWESQYFRMPDEVNWAMSLE